jgi:hypothetical protein
MHQSAESMAMVKAIIAMAHSLRLEVIAEGVELQEQLDGLRAAGCDQIQGFYYSKPLSADDCAAYLREHAALQLKHACKSLPCARTSIYNFSTATLQIGIYAVSAEPQGRDAPAHRR